MLSRRLFLSGIFSVPAGLSKTVAARSEEADISANTAIQVDGTKIVVDERARRLRGVGMGDPALLRLDRTAADYLELAGNWNCQIVRISVHPGVWKSDPAGALRSLEFEVAAARRARMAVIIDWHVIGWPDGGYETPDTSWGLRPDIYDSSLALAEAFWGHISARYASDRAIMFELWNEPVRLDDPDLQRGDGGDWDELRPIWIRLLSTVRKNARNLVLVTGGNWAADLSGVASAPIEDENLAYSWHVYPGTDRGDGTSLSMLLGGVPSFAPVVVTEWGFSDLSGHLYGSVSSFGDRFTREFLDRYCLHWTAWCWAPLWQPAMFEPDWETMTDFGDFVRRELTESQFSVRCD